MRRIFLQSVVFLTLLPAQLMVCAAEVAAVANQATPVKKMVATGPDAVTVIVGLLAVVALILLLGFFLKRFNPALLQKNSPIKVLASQAVGQRERIVLVAIGDQQLLLGVTAQQVSHLHTLAEPVIIPELAPSAFASQLQDVLARRSS